MTSLLKCLAVAGEVFKELKPQQLTPILQTLLDSLVCLIWKILCFKFCSYYLVFKMRTLMYEILHSMLLDWPVC